MACLLGFPRKQDGTQITLTLAQNAVTITRKPQEYVAPRVLYPHLTYKESHMAKSIILQNPVLSTDFAPETYGRLTTIGPVFRFPKVSNQRHTELLQECRCSCGKVRMYTRSRLKAGQTKSCGCLQKDKARMRQTTHNGVNRPEYCNWQAMHQRCADPNQKHYVNYGGRGIYVCARWSGPDGFQNFLADMGPRPSQKMKYIDRKDNDGPYSPENCRWSTNKEQCNNKRNCKLFTIEGVTKTMTEWAESRGLCRHFVKKRIKRGWSIEEALNTPSGQARTANNGLA